MTCEDANKIVAAIDRNTEAIHWSGVSRTVMLCLLICSISCPRSKASPITRAPVAEPLQYWHTQWVPADGGVYPQEVYAPALPRVEPELYVFTDIGDPPRLTETPEPGTWSMVGGVALLLIIGGYPMRLYIKSEKRALSLKLALIDVEYSGDIKRIREIARKALEETK